MNARGKHSFAGLIAATALAMLLLVTPSARAQQDPLPSWNDGPVKTAILDFVTRTTKEGSPAFVKPPERIATFDNDGTLWCEHPLYFQLMFALDRIKALAPEHPEWKDKEPFASILKGDTKAALAGGDHALLEIIMATHAGMTTDQFAATVMEWMKTARHPRFKRPYDQLVYQPMLELLAYLRANEFKTFIVSGGGIEFMRPWVPQVYGIPPEQVVGSSGVVKFEMKDGKPVLMKEPKVEFIDDGPGKPVGINRFIGRRPIAAFGNSDGDLQMLEYTTINGPANGSPADGIPADGKRQGFGLLVHHTDAEREYAYDRDTHIGKLDKALDAAKERGWTVVDMKRDWKVIFPKEK